MALPILQNLNMGGSESSVAGIKVVSNQAVGNVAGANVAFWKDKFGNDSRSWVEIPAKSTVDNEDVAVLLGCQNLGGAFDGYGFFARNRNALTDLLFLIRFDNGVGTQFGSTIASEFASGDAIGLRREGNLFRSYVRLGGTWFLAHTDVAESTYTGVGNLGLYVVGTTYVLDNFNGGGDPIGAGYVPTFRPRRR